MVLLSLALGLLVLHLLLLGTLLYGKRRTFALPAEIPERSCPWPRVSIVIAARDEEADIENALQSILAFDYPDYEVIVVNDRSTDGTGRVLQRLQAAQARLRVIDVESLPAGWLGKNHALYQGAALASGDLFLFTDADIVFSPDCLKKTVGVLGEEKLDHLTLSPRIRSPSLWVNLLVAAFARNFSLFVRPWQARNPKSTAFIGIGAFNLVRRSVYQQVGGHERIRLRPDDDMKLGKLIKQAGFRQEIRFAFPDLSLSWYPNFGSMARGLEKNVLAGIDYRIWPAFLGLALLIVQEVVPWVLVVVGRPLVQLLALGAGLVWVTAMAMFFPQTRTSYWWVFLVPLAGLLLVYIFTRSVILTLVRRGIVWRNTFYPLGELRKNSV